MKNWPKFATPAPPKTLMECKVHGKGSSVVRRPDHISPERVSLLSKKDNRWGCHECVKAAEAEDADRERAEREEKERAIREKRAAKRAVLNSAKRADLMLQDAIESYEKVMSQPTPAQLQQKLEEAEKALGRAQDKLAAAQAKVSECEERVAMLRTSKESDEADRETVKKNIVASFEIAEQAWADVSRVKRDRLRDKSIRARARKIVDGIES